MTFVPSSSEASEIISIVRGRCRLGVRPPNAELQDTALYRSLNDVNDWFVYWSLDKHGKQPLKRLRRETLIEPKDNTTLASAYTVGDANVVLTSSSDFGSPSATDPFGGYIKNSDGTYDFFTYEDTATSPNLAGHLGIDVGHAAESEVHRIYELPATFGQPRTLQVNNRQEYKYRDGEFESVPPPGFFHIKWLTSKTNSLDRPFVVLPYSVPTNSIFTLYYIKRPTEITGATSKIDAWNGTERWAIIKKMEAHVWSIRGEDEMSREADDKAEELMESIHARDAQYNASPNQGPMFGF